MQDVNELPGTALETNVEVPRHTLVRDVTMKSDAFFAQLPDDFLGIILRRAIVDYFNLHPADPGILRQDALEALAQIFGAVESRDHHRPQRPRPGAGNRLDRWSL
jgi:hypothetical protein